MLARQQIGQLLMVRVSKQLGVTLIELMITLAILGILVIAAMPGYTIWIQNAQIRTASDAILNGLQLARAEAVRRNALTQFALASGTGWSITIGSEVVRTRSAGEGSKNVISTSVDDASKVTFNGLGRISPNADASASITQLDLDVPTTILDEDDSRDLRILIEAGQIRLCDPNVSDAGDPRKCP
jgi:type IV fimbrial biogenesis protein FimT